MAFFNNQNQNDEGGQSKFNPAALKMSRIDDTTELINNCWLNPFGFNMEYNTWNYLLIFQNGINLFKEISSKLSSVEREECQTKQKVLGIVFERHPIIEFNKSKGKWIPNETNWNIIKHYLEDYELTVRKYQDKHGMDTPTEDESSLF